MVELKADLDLEELMNREIEILIVDDTPENLQVLASILQKRHYEVNMAASGEDALFMVNEKKPDLILLDISMPEMDGYQVCEKLKSTPLTKEIPVIFLTAHNDIESIVRGFDCGAVDYVTKPCNPTELIVRIRTHLELKRHREIMTRQNEKLRELNKDKDGFLGIAAHDLINPLNAIMGFCRIIEREKHVPDRIDEYISYILMATKRMHGIIKNLLDVHKIEQGRIENKPEHIDLDKSVNSLMENHRSHALSKHIALELENNSPGKSLLMDPFVIDQVLDNLISNAIKFSPPGKKVTVRVSIGEGHINLQVADQGPGFTEDDKKKMFGKFARLSAAPTGDENSTGLGLSIVKMLIDGVKGSIAVESEPSQGALFTVQIPLTSAQPGEA
jgi:two-component system, sensor histidine kinase and response regulator